MTKLAPVAVACPGCGKTLKMPDITRVRAPAYFHNCKVLGVMPDPADPAALMEWAAGALKPGGSTRTVKAVDTETVTRARVHVPFDETKCTKDGCSIRGKVPGVRRHIGFMHQDEEAELVAKLPPNRTIDGLLTNFEKDEAAAHRVIESLGLSEKFPPELESWSWEEAAVAVLNAVEDPK